VLTASLCCLCQVISAAISALHLCHWPSLFVVQQAAEGLNAVAGLNDISTARYLAAVFGAYPMALLFSSIPGRFSFLKHLVGAALGIYLAQWVYGVQWIHSFISSFIVYLMVVGGSFIPGVKHLVPWFVFVFAMLYMTAGHLVRQFVNSGGTATDWTGPQMVLTIKLIEFGWNYYDGVVARARLTKLAASGTRAAGQAKRQLDSAVEYTPSPVEYFSYIFNFTTYFAGPAFEIKKFLQANDGSAYGKAGTAPPASRFLNGLGKMVVAVAYMAIYVTAQGYVPLKDNITAEAVADTSFWGIATSRYPKLWLALVFATQFKYYFVWKLTEGSAVWAGFGYEPKNTNDQWGGVIQVDVLGFQTAPSFGKATRYWNMRTQHWLDHYIYRRITRTASINMWATYFASAFWHGFYPGYYLTFMSAPLFGILEKQLIKVVNPILYAGKDGKPSAVAVQPRKGRAIVAGMYSVLCSIVINITLNYLALPFVITEWHPSIATWSSLHFFVHVGCAALYVPAFVLPALGCCKGPRLKSKGGDAKKQQ